MKQFLRYLFVVAAMLMVVVGDVWGQTYNGGTWYSLYDGETKSNTTAGTTFCEKAVFAPAESMTFEYIKYSWASINGDLEVQNKVNGSWSGSKGSVSYSDYKNWKTSGTINLDPNISHIRYKMSGTGAKVRNHFVKLKKHILLESGTYGTSSITVTDGNLATAEGYTSTNAYKIKLRSFLSSGNIKMTSNNPEFHFGNGVTEIYLGVANNYCASANGSGTCTSASVLGQISNYFKDVYFSPSVQYNTTARSTTITITDGVNTAYVYLTAPVIPTYYFKAEAIAEPTTAGVATATFVNGQSTYSLVAPNVGTNSMSTDVTFAASAGANSVFEGWKKVAEDTYYKQGSGTESFTETITSSVLDPRGMASQKTYRAIFSERYTASMETNDISGLKIGDSVTAVYSFINTSAAIPSSDENADFHYVITHRPDNTTKNGSADASKVVSFDPTTKQVVGLNSGSATITFVQKANANYVYVEKSFEVIVEKNDISAWIVKGDAVLNELVENAFSVTDGLQDYSVESLNSSIAEYVAGNKIQTYFTEGTAQFRVTRDEDYKYVGLNELFDLEVKKSEESCILFNTTHDEEYKVGYYDNEDGFEFNLGGEGASINLELKKQDGGGGHIYITGYTSSGTEVSLGDVKGSDLSTSWSKHTFDFPTDKDIVKIKIEAGNDIWNDALNKYFRNVQVTRKTYLRPTVNPLALPQATIGRPVSASFDLNWSTCSDEIVLVSTNSNFVLNQYSIDATSGRGTTTITVTYDANSGSQSGTIIIYDQSQKIEIPVSCEVKSKLATEIIYTGEQQYGEIADGILYPFYVKDENGNTVTDATITLATSNEDILSFDADKIYPHCGGNVTLTANYAGDATHKPATLEKTITIADCNQQIIWDQDFRTYIATEDGSIAETTVLEAYAIPTGTPITYTLDETAAKFAEIRYNTENGTYSLYVHGVGKGFITASVNACNFEDEQYLAAEVIREIRVHKEGDPCDSYSIDDWNEYNITLTNSTKVLNLSGLPETTMTFWAHAQEGSISNELKVDFSKDGNNWEGQQEFSLKASSSNTQYTCNTVVEGAKYVRFRTGSTLKSFFHGICIRQKTYLTPSVNTILIENAIVNQPFTYSFTVDYSDVPLIQHSVTNDNNLGLTITPANEDIHNVCGEYGSYTFTLTGTSLYPQTNVTETLTITTPVGHDIKIPVTITSSLLDTYYFNQQDGNWSDPANWTVNGSTSSTLPTASNPVVIAKKVTIDNHQAVAYSVEMQDGAHIKIASTGGLTVHAGGYTTTSQEPNLEITIDKEQAGYFRMSPLAKTDMPKAKVYFTTRGQLNGGNQDAAWQYIGAPGSGVGMDLAHTTVLYLRSEEKGWVRQYTEWAQLTPFDGYALTQKEQSTFTLYPQLLNADQTIQLTYTEEGMRGDNLWANSYMAPLDITKFSQEDFTGNVDRTFYLYNSGSWNDWNNDQSATNDANVYTPGRYYAINLAQIDATKDQTVIPPMQGVYMTAGEGGGTLTINYEKHVWNNSQTGKMNTPLRIAPHSEENQSADFLRIRLQVNSENSGADRMYVIQDSLATSGYDNGYDAPKQMATGLMNIYTNEPFGKMEISSTDHMDGMYIGFEAGEDSEYAMTFTSLLGDSLYLYDSQQDLIIEMVNDEQYHFIAEPYSVNDFRFQIMVAPELSEEDNNNQGGVTTNVDNISTPSVWVNQGKLYVTNSQENSTIAIYTASGMLVAAPYTIKHTPCTINIAHLPAGVYVLRLNDQAYKFICE